MKMKRFILLPMLLVLAIPVIKAQEFDICPYTHLKMRDIPAIATETHKYEILIKQELQTGTTKGT